MYERSQGIEKKSDTKKGGSAPKAQDTEFSPSTSTSADCILSLQRSVGNQAVQRLFKDVSGRRSAAGGQIQPKLTIGQPNDICEQEADRVAEQVMRMPDRGVQRQAEEEEQKEEILQTKPIIDQITPLVQRQVEEEEEEMLQAKRREDATSEVSNDLESQINAIKGGGRGLGESERAFFEPRFGHDFSRVQLHTDTQAADAARAVNARAFTTGRDVVFGAGEYASGTAVGKRLLAHELVHVVQQKGDMSYGKHMQEVDGVARSVTQLGQQRTSKQNTRVKQEISTNERITSKSDVLIHLQSIGKTTNHDPLFYRKRIHEFQQENSAEKISASQKQILESPKSMDIRQKDSSQTLRRCVAGCATPSTTTQSFTRGQTLAVDSGNNEGWIRGRLGTSASGTEMSFPDYLKVNYQERRGGRDYFRIMEGPHNSQTASLLPGYLVSGINWEGPASVTFREDSSNSTQYQSNGQLDYGGGIADAKIYVSPPDQKIAANRDYPLRLPDFPHPGGARYGHYAKTWFRLVGGPQGDEYLHRGRFSSGCVTVTSDNWPAIYQHLIKKRQDNQHIGTIRRIIP